ncbi:MAG: hypothetical protein J0M17_22975 [Planctomycetes bacterium]|nr:hypothetical protein [Planctomycetota bacterium]
MPNKVPADDDIVRFLQGKLIEGSPEWERIAADLEKDADGFVGRYIDEYCRRLADEGARCLDGIWERLASRSPGSSEHPRPNFPVRSAALRAARLKAGLESRSVVDRVNEERPGAITLAQYEAYEAGLVPLPIPMVAPVARALRVRPGNILVPEPVEGVVLLRDSYGGSAIETGGANAPPPADIERELLDFVDETTARAMVAAWKAGGRQLAAWSTEYLSACRDAYRGSLVEALCQVSLFKDHENAGQCVDRLVELAGEDPRRGIDASYLQGRQRWYVRRIPEAVAALKRAYDEAGRQSDYVRRAQALHYLMRIAVDYPDFAVKNAEDCYREGLELAGKIPERQDLRLLFVRAEALRLHKAKQYDESKRLLKSLLAEAKNSDSLDPEHIMASLYVAYAQALRRDCTEAARQEAERIYRWHIDRPRDDSHGAMCRYLLADLHIDRMLDALRAAAAGEPLSEAYRMSIADAERHHAAALRECETARLSLEATGDVAALQKASRRLVFLRNLDLGAPVSATTAADEFALREHQLSCLFLGAPIIGRSGAYDAAANSLERDDLDRFLDTLELGAQRVTPGAARDVRPTERLLNAKSVLCVPRQVGDALVVRLFRIIADNPRTANFGWFSIRNYASQLRPLFGDFLALTDEEFVGARPELFEAIQGQVETILPLGDEKGQCSDIDDLVILAPASNADWVCPLEWLTTLPLKKGETGIRLLDLPKRSLVYASPSSLPLALVSRPPDASIPFIAVSTQSVRGERLSDAVRGTIPESVAFDVRSSPAPEVGQAKCLIVIAHDDQAGELRGALEAWDFRFAEAVYLLFCSSGHYDLVSGPFLAGAVQRIRAKMRSTAPLIAARVPVGLEEAIGVAQLAAAWCRTGQDPMKSLLTYLRDREPGDAFDAPWVVLT